MKKKRKENSKVKEKLSLQEADSSLLRAKVQNNQDLTNLEQRHHATNLEYGGSAFHPCL